MRLVAFDDLEPGMQIADDFYGESGSILAKRGAEITERYLKRLSQYEIPFLYVLDKYSEDIHVKCTITSGARNEATQHLRNLYMGIKQENKRDYPKLLKACLKAIDGIIADVISEKIDLYDVFDIKMIENYDYQQPVNVMIISIIMGKALGMTSLELNELAICAYFHDIGNLFVPDSILNKVDKLTDQEFKIVKQHAELGYKFAKEELEIPMKAYLGISQHHERFDGNGYPYGKVGLDISRYARIVAIADVFDALSSRRRHRVANNPFHAFKLIVEGIGTQFDPEFVKLFADTVSPYPIGYSLRLPEDKLGIVTMNFKGRPFNPLVRVVEENGKPLLHPYVITLGAK